MASPIPVHTKTALSITSSLSIQGTNTAAVYNPDLRIYEVVDDIVLSYNGNIYALREYHFHVPAEHCINGKNYAGELHLVFSDGVNVDMLYHDVCGSYTPNHAHENIVIVCIPIKNASRSDITDFSSIQPAVPNSFFQYDAINSRGDQPLRVRMLVATAALKLRIKNVDIYAKRAKPEVAYDGRIILFTSS